MKFDVYIIKFFNYYDIEAENQDEALEIAEGYFRETMCCPIADLPMMKLRLKFLKIKP